jgi:hypothetical protein
MVATLGPVAGDGEATIMTGSHFYNGYSLEQSLGASMRHALWHHYWANITHDDVDLWRARILVLVAMRCGFDPAVKRKFQAAELRALPLTERSLYALLYMALFAPLFQSHLQSDVEDDGLLGCSTSQLFDKAADLRALLNSGGKKRTGLVSREWAGSELADGLAALELAGVRRVMYDLAKHIVLRLPASFHDGWVKFKVEWDQTWANEALARDSYAIQEAIEGAI